MSPLMSEVEPLKEDRNLEAKIQKMEVMVKTKEWQQLKEFVCELQ